MSIPPSPVYVTSPKNALLVVVVSVLPPNFTLFKGGKTDQNAHPHTDYGSRIALVHNGTINNAHDLRGDLERRGISFK